MLWIAFYSCRVHWSAPGEEHWSAVMPASIRMEGEGDSTQIPEDNFYPATVLPSIKLSAHHPVYLDLPFVEETRQPKTSVLSTQSITPELWVT